MTAIQNIDEIFQEIVQEILRNAYTHSLQKQNYHVCNRHSMRPQKYNLNLSITIKAEVCVMLAESEMLWSLTWMWLWEPSKWMYLNK